MTEKTVKIEVDVTEEAALDIATLIDELGYGRDDGLRLLLGAGLMALRNEHLGPDADLPKRGRARWLEVEKELAVLRFRHFRSEEANHNWELSTGAIQAQNMAYETLIENQRREIESLRAQLGPK